MWSILVVALCTLPSGTAVLLVEQTVSAGPSVTGRVDVQDRGEARIEGQADDLLDSWRVRNPYLSRGG